MSILGVSNVLESIYKNRLVQIVFWKFHIFTETYNKIRGVLMIWSKKCLIGPGRLMIGSIRRMLESEVAKEILVELFDIRTHEVDEMIRHRMEERTLYGQEFDL